MFEIVATGKYLQSYEVKVSSWYSPGGTGRIRSKLKFVNREIVSGELKVRFEALFEDTGPDLGQTKIGIVMLQY